MASSLLPLLIPPTPLDRSARPGGYSIEDKRQANALLFDGLLKLATKKPDQPQTPQGSAPGSALWEAGMEQNPYAPRPGMLGAILGNDNPISQWTADNRNFLRGVGSALLTPSMDFSQVPMYSALDDERRTKSAEWTTADASKRQMIKTLTGYGYTDIAEGLASGALDPKTAWNEMFRRHATEAQEAKVAIRNKANAAFITNPELRAAVEAGALDFAEAYKLQQGGEQSLMNVGDGTIYNPNTGEWMTNPNGAAAAPDIKELFGFEKDLWAQYSNSDPVKTYEAVKGGFERVRESAGQQSGAGDMGLIYGYMRMLDPGSVVRESEFAMAAQAGSFGEQVQGLVTKLLNGERLPESVRKQFLENAEKLYAASADNLTDINTQFTDRAGGYGVDPQRFIRQPEAFAPYGQPTAVSTKAQYDSLPSGTQYTAPDGSVRVKP